MEARTSIAGEYGNYASMRGHQWEQAAPLPQSGQASAFEIMARQAQEEVEALAEKIAQLETGITEARVEQHVAKRKAEGLVRLIAELREARITAQPIAEPEIVGKQEAADATPVNVDRPRRGMRFILWLVIVGFCFAALALGTYYLNIPGTLADHIPVLRPIVGLK
ncbi:hypothetical protein [Paraburkholderia antibiotica]|uniref:Uncharacterized protein n=1 Tax=Paraburkholderia antibiotica TaxID=2728839 RepID=A0A7X9ZY30_9BURK|nr:hypothetical protein [Paraburkholderia antibiotica]NML32724.1 hypothetical protein [Paraburkholderia antibiotica]